MAKVISQETFDEVVQENVVDFSMSPTEAKEETIKQFEAQGINLSNIIKDLSINKDSGKPILNEAIEEIKKHIGEKSNESVKLLQLLNILDAECQKSLAHRVLAGKNGAYDVLITLCGDELHNVEHNSVVLKKCLQALNSLILTQPDLFNAEALAVMWQLLVSKYDKDIIVLTLKWVQRVCVMHEMNRQNLMSSGIIKLLKPFINENDVHLIRELTAVFRFLILDDDIRIEFGRAHEHARQIASEVLLDLVHLLTVYSDERVLADLLLTIGALSVRHEFCIAIDEAGGLELVFNIMVNHLESDRINREALKLLRALAGHDTVKLHIVEQGAAPIIKKVLETHASNENVVSAALASISTLTLRVKENSAAFFQTGIAEIIVESMRRHVKHKVVQRNGAWAIRNMVSRSRNQCDTWLSYGIEDLLNAAMSNFPNVQQDIKAALRDLGCKVELREEWTGTAEKKIEF